MVEKMDKEAMKMTRIDIPMLSPSAKVPEVTADDEVSSEWQPTWPEHSAEVSKQ